MNYKIAFCGINYEIASYYLKKNTRIMFTEVSKDDNYDFIIMNNRHNGNLNDERDNVKTCYDSYKGETILSVKRNGLILSAIKKN